LLDIPGWARRLGLKGREACVAFERDATREENAGAAAQAVAALNVPSVIRGCVLTETANLDISGVLRDDWSG
jgi:hypothetical protein